jgi:membrane protease YdiL (CAAX protease family)
MKLPQIKNPDGQARSGYKIFGFIALLLGLGALAALLVMLGLLPGGPAGEWALAAAALGASWLCLKWEGEPLSSIGLRMNVRFFIEFAIGALLGAALIMAIALTIKLFGGFAWERGQASLGGIFYMLAPFLALSVYEELLFRGDIFQRAVQGMGRAYALLLFALFFVVGHWGNPGTVGPTKLRGSLNIGLASRMLGLAWIKTKSLALPFGIHLGWNWAQGPLLGFGVSGGQLQGYWKPMFNDMPQWFTGGSFGLEASLPGAIVCAVACAGLAAWGREYPTGRFPSCPALRP